MPESGPREPRFGPRSTVGARSFPTRSSVSEYRNQLIAVIKDRGLFVLDEPIQLASGEWSTDYVNSKRGLRRGLHLKLAAEALLELVREEGLDFDAVGGLTMGADPLAHEVAVLADEPARERDWFSVRKEDKGRGTGATGRVEGAELKRGVDVLLVDDVVTLGGSIIDAYEAIVATGATVVMAVTLLDRGEVATAKFAELGIPYRALVTYADLGIVPVGQTRGDTRAAG